MLDYENESEYESQNYMRYDKDKDKKPDSEKTNDEIDKEEKVKAIEEWSN